MSNPFKAIAISLLPNFSWRDFFWEDVPAERLAGYLHKKHAVLFESGRVAEYFLLKALGVGAGDEVIIQAFTCVAVPNSIAWTGARPVYVDIDKSLNLDPEKLVKAITPKTKAVIFQSTFGDSGQINKVRAICQKKDLFFIEDGAHSLKMVGDLAFFSFGRDKVMSGAYGCGGAVVTNDTTLWKKLLDLTANLPAKKQSWFYLPAVYFVLQTYNFFSLGRAVHKLLKNFLPKVLTPEEKQGLAPDRFYGPPPGALAQLAKLDGFVKHRQEMAQFYAKELGGHFDQNCTYLRYSIFVDDPAGLRRFAARRGIFLGDWYDQVVAPKGVGLAAVGYKPGSCPVAEKVCQRIVNLPINPNMNLDDAKKVVDTVKLWKR